MKEIYSRNIPTLSEEEQMRLNNASVLVIGCGGLGGYIIEHLARIGIGHITAVDGDVFCESNLNRQLLSNQDNIGKSKADAALARIKSIDPEIDVTAVDKFLTAESASELVGKTDLVIDALDNVESRLILEDVCEEKKVTLIHGAVQGWILQVSVVPPGSRVIHSIYKKGSDTHESAEQKSCLSPTVACCASIQVAEAVKLLIGRDSTLSGNILSMDLQTMEIFMIPTN